MKRFWLAPGALALLAAGCQSDGGGAPRLPASPPATGEPAPPDETPEPVHRTLIGFGGPLFQPGATLTLRPGERLLLPVMAGRGSDYSRGGAGPGLSVLVRTDAPPSVLTVSAEVRVRSASEPGLVEVRALDRAPGGGEPGTGGTETWRVWLEEDPAQVFAEGWGFGLDPTPLRFSVAAARAPSPPCEGLELTARAATGSRDGGIRAPLVFGSLAEDFRQVEVALRAGHPETSLTLLSRYTLPYEDLDPDSERARVQYGLYPTTFAFDLGFREAGSGFEQTMVLGVFDALRLRAEAPGCEAVELSCDAAGRCTVG